MLNNKLKCSPFSESCRKIIENNYKRYQEPVLEVSRGDVFTEQSKVETFQTYFSTSIIY